MIYNCFVVIREPFKDKLNLIFMIKSFPEKSKLIKMCCEPLELIIDRFCSLGPLFQLLLELFDVATARSCVCGGKSAQDFCRGVDGGEQRLHGGGDCAKESTVNKLILTLS